MTGLPTLGLVDGHRMRGRGPASPAAPRPGTPNPDADRPVACWTGCHLAAARVKGASRSCGLACGPP